MSRSFGSLLPLLLALAIPVTAAAQQEGPQPTQALVTVDSKSPATLAPADVTVDLNGKSTPVDSFTPLRPDQTQIAILIDDGLRTSVGRQLDDIRKFIQGLPQGTEVFLGYMQNGRVMPGAALHLRPCRCRRQPPHPLRKRRHQRQSLLLPLRLLQELAHRSLTVRCPIHTRAQGPHRPYAHQRRRPL